MNKGLLLRQQSIPETNISLVIVAGPYGCDEAGGTDVSEVQACFRVTLQREVWCTVLSVCSKPHREVTTVVHNAEL